MVEILLIDCSYLHKIPIIGPSYTEFVLPRYWHFDHDATIKIDDILTENGGLLNVFPFAFHLKLQIRTSRGDHSE